MAIMKDSLAFIIQARLGSSRLPNKIVLPFFNHKNVLDLLLDKLKLSFPNIPIILATTTNKQDDTIANIGEYNKVNVYRGSENNVLTRFTEAANLYNKKHIIRICSDNPFLSVSYLNDLIDYVNSSDNDDYDYISFVVNGKPSIKTHYGFWTEYVKLSALEKVKQMTNDLFYYEHVTNYIYEDSDKFKIKFIPISKAIETYDSLRLTMDTITDFNLLSDLYSNITRIKNDDSIIDIDDVIRYIDSQGSDIILQMKKEIENNRK